MSRIVCTVLGTLMLSSAGAIFVNAQAGTSTAAQTFSVAPTLPGTGGEQGIVKLDVVVKDPAGSPVSSLEQKDFTIFDNGQSSRILAFHRFDGVTSKARPPVEFILFLDSLEIPKETAEFERQEVQRYLRQNGGHLNHPTSVYGVSPAGLWTVKLPSADGNMIADQLEKSAGIRKVLINSEAPGNGMSGRGGAFGSSPISVDLVRRYPIGAAFEAVTAIATSARRRPGRKMLLWIGAGCCKGSGASLPGPTYSDDKKTIFDMATWASTLFREAHMTIYSFSEGEQDANRAQDYQPAVEGAKSAADVSFMSIYKKVLAIQTGGRVMTPNSSREGKTYELMNQIDDVVRGADSFYMVAFDASHANHLDEYHPLKVEVDRPGLTVFSKTGYYDQPYFLDEPEPELRKVTIEQVEAILKTDRADRDAELAKQLSYLELTERMTSAKLRNWMMMFRGKKTRAALVALSDASAFLDPPQEEVLPDVAPSAGEIQKMLARVGDYLLKTMPKLPNFFASRTTVRYEDAPAFEQGNSKTAFKPLHIVDTSKVTVLYRNSDEVIESRQKNHALGNHQLETHGTFGPMLSFVSSALATHDALHWSRWERGGDGRKAVFRWTVPLGKSQYSVGGCCLPDGDGTIAVSNKSGYAGEIAIDPDTGALLRFALKSDLSSNDLPITTPLARSGIMIEYGTIEVGGIPYVCPIRSVTISRVRSVVDLNELDQSFKSYGPYWMLLNDVTFDNYHRFRSDAQMVTGSPVDQ